MERPAVPEHPRGAVRRSVTLAFRNHGLMRLEWDDPAPATTRKKEGGTASFTGASRPKAGGASERTRTSTPEGTGT